MDANVIEAFGRARAAAQAGHTEREVVAVEVPSGRRGGTGGRAFRGGAFCGDALWGVGRALGVWTRFRGCLQG
jgi:hypothetical protein